MTTTPAPVADPSVDLVPDSPSGGTRRNRRNWGPFLYLSAPIAVLLLFFAGPMAILVMYSFQLRGRGESGAWTLVNYQTVTQSFYWEVALDSLIIALWAMAVILFLAYPLAYVIAFRSGKWEIPLLLMLVLSDELNPLIRIFAWKTVLGREGVVNTALAWIGVIDEPLDWLLFTKFTVIVVLSVSWLPYAVLPIYAAMKTVSPDLIEAAQDLGAGWFTIFRKILLPLTAAGFMATVIIVFVPILSDYAAPVLVGGTEGIMISTIIGEEFLGRGQWGIGSALTFVLLMVSTLIVWLSYKLTNLKKLQT